MEELLNPNPKNLVKEMANTPKIPQPVEMQNANPLAVKAVEEWIQRVSQFRSELGGFSVCPYASKASYKIVECDIDKLELISGYDILIYIVNESSLEEINKWVKYYNEKYSDWIFLEDCATYDTFINGVQTNNGSLNLILAQPKKDLLKAREALKKTSYYSYWSKEYYNEIVGD